VGSPAGEIHRAHGDFTLSTRKAVNERVGECELKIPCIQTTDVPVNLPQVNSPSEKWWVNIRFNVQVVDFCQLNDIYTIIFYVSVHADQARGRSSRERRRDSRTERAVGSRSPHAVKGASARRRGTGSQGDLCVDTIGMLRRT